MTTPLAQQFEGLWESGDSPPDVFSFLQQHNGSASDEVLGVLLADQRRRWKTDAPLMVEEYLENLPNLVSHPGAKLQLAVGEFWARQEANTAPDINEFASRFRDITDQLRRQLARCLTIFLRHY